MTNTIPFQDELLSAIDQWRMHEARWCSCRQVEAADGVFDAACHVNGTIEFAVQARRAHRMRHIAHVAREARREPQAATGWQPLWERAANASARGVQVDSGYADRQYDGAHGDGFADAARLIEGVT